MTRWTEKETFCFHAMHKNDKQNNYSSDPSWKSLLADTSYNALNNFVTCLNRVLNPFTPNSDKHLRSPNSITPESNITGHGKKRKWLRTQQALNC